VTVTALALAGLLAGGSAWAATAFAPAAVGSRRVVRVLIRPGTRSDAIARQLAAAGVLRSPLAFELLALWEGDAGRLQAGEYEFSPGMTPAAILARIVRGEVVTYRVTVPEGADVEQVATAVAASGLASRDAVLAAARDPALVAGLVPPGVPVRYPVEGYLFPDTYTFTRADDAHAILAAMVARTRQALTPQLRAEAAAQNLTLHQVLTLASIVQREASRPADQAAVAAVYRNRLRLGMDLQSDPTVLYALGRSGGPLTAQDLKDPSPYNTYAHPGLPPGPIASPGLSAIEAVLHPADVPYLFFIAKPDGTLVFAQTYAEQLANERAYLHPTP
jgi:UPF0755 protein